MRSLPKGKADGDESDEETEQYKQAVAQFQGDQKLKQTGELDAATRSKIESLHT